MGDAAFIKEKKHACKFVVGNRDRRDPLERWKVNM
jgi:hypothetical protein